VLAWAVLHDLPHFTLAVLAGEKGACILKICGRSSQPSTDVLAIGDLQPVARCRLISDAQSRSSGSAVLGIDSRGIC